MYQAMMLSFCFPFNIAGLHPLLPQYSTSPWNNSSFELLLLALKYFSAILLDFEACSGIKVKVWHRRTLPGWEGRALPLLKEVKEYVRHSRSFSPASLHPGEGCLRRCAERWGFHKNAQWEPIPEIKPWLLGKTYATIADWEGLSIGTRAVSWQEGGNSNWSV